MVRRSEGAAAARLSLPQTGPEQGDVVVAPSHHNLSDVGSRSELGAGLASAEPEHNKALERGHRQKEGLRVIFGRSATKKRETYPQ